MIKKFCLIVIVLLTVTGCKDKPKETQKEKDSVANVTITIDEYEKLKKGMEFEEVTKIIGGECISTDKSNEYYCSGDFAGTEATLIFEDGILKEKKQVGLE